MSDRPSPKFVFSQWLRLTTRQLSPGMVAVVFTGALLASMTLAQAPSTPPAALQSNSPPTQDLTTERHFNRDVRPILSDHCFHCHGPDPKTREADLRLDTATGLATVVEASNPQQSELYVRVVTTDDDQRMPPPSSHKPLSASQIEILKQWIQQGGIYEGHWAFQPIAQADSHRNQHQPDARRQAASRTVDQLIERRMKEAGLKPVAAADRVTLLRRLSFDLTGLPPTPAEVESFCKDAAPDAYRKQVDRLLASPHFGERMAMWWLDLVRYADSVGYHGDQDVSVSPFRDYVIASFNDNKPFDVFTREQLAGDLLPAPTQTQLIASGYNRLGMMSAEGGVQPKEYLAKYISERVRNVSGTWMGVTMGCCECHDHKFDPFSTREFYQMEAFFADIQERGLYSRGNKTDEWGPSIPVPTQSQLAQQLELKTKLEQVQTLLDQSTPALEAAQLAWEDSRPQWITLKPQQLHSLHKTELVPQDDLSILAKGTPPTQDTYVVTSVWPETESSPQPLTAFRLELLTDERLPRQGPGRAGNGNFVLTEFKAEFKAKLKAASKEVPADAPNPATSPEPQADLTPSDNTDSTPSPDASEFQSLRFRTAFASFEQVSGGGKSPYKKWPIQAAIDEEKHGSNWGWAIMEQAGRDHAAVFLLENPLSIRPLDSLQFTLEQNHENPKHTIGRFRLSVTSSPIASLETTPEAIEKILETERAQRSIEQRGQLAAYYRSIAPSLAPHRSERIRLEKQLEQLTASITTTLVTQSVEPREIRVLPRGNWMDQTGDVVQPGFPRVLSFASYSPTTSSPQQRLNRRHLAEWLVSPEHPLTSRVLVNRLWKLLFGAGLARNLDDLGAQGSPPTHPELLDFLAREMIESDWDIKSIIRLILLSETYQRASLASVEQVQRDPYNSWWARQGRFRLDAELVRDNALSISGLLVKQIGGRSVKPYQPAGYWAYLNFPTRRWQAGRGDELYRRGLYTHWQRQYLHPSLLAFDAPNREECTAERPRSNTPLQSLVLLNDPTFVEAARAFAQTTIQQAGPQPEERLRFIFQRALSRDPTHQEVELLIALLDRTRQQYNATPKLADQLLQVGVRPAPKELDKLELASWTAITRTVINLHETMTRN